MTENIQRQPFALRSLSYEQQIVALLIGQSVSFGLMLAFLISSVSAIFLSAFGSERLPYVYIGVGVMASAAFYGLGELQRRWPLTRLTVTLVSSFVAFHLLGWSLMLLPDSAWVSAPLLALFQIFIPTGFVVMGSQAGRLLDVRQIKQQFPRVIMGFALGFMIGGWLVGLVLRIVANPIHLLFIAALFASSMLLFLMVLTRRFGPRLNQVAETKSSRSQPAKSLRQLLNKRFVQLIFLYQMLSAMGTLLVEFLLLVKANEIYPTAAEFAHFFGNFTGFLNLTDILFGLFLAGFLMNRYGMLLGLSGNPLVITILIGFIALTGAVGGLTGFFFFGLIAAARILDLTLTDGFTRSAINAAYQALPNNERITAQVGVEGIGVPIAFGLTGVLLLVFQALVGTAQMPVVLFTLVACILWTAAGLWVYRGYRQSLVQTLSRRALDKADFSLDDGSTLTVLENMLQSTKPHDVSLALDLLTEARYPQLDQRLIELLEHETAVIRNDALQRIEAQRLEAALPMVQAMLTQEKDEKVLGTAVRTLCALSDLSDFTHITPYLNDGLSETSIGAMVGLLRYGGIPGVLAAGQQLTTLEASANPADRQIVARVIGDVGIDSFFHPLLPLLQDPNSDVRRTALVAAAQVPHPRLLPYVIDNLANPLTRSAAMSALQATGQRLLPTVAAALAGEAAHREEALIRMVRVCGQIKGQQVIDTLKPHINHPDNDVQLAVLSALHLSGYRAMEAGETAVIRRTLRGEVGHGLRVLLAKQELGSDAVYAAVHRALDHEYEEARQRTFLLLSFIYDTQAILRAEEQLFHGNSASQALALETLDVTLTNEEKQMLFPLIDAKLTPEQRIKQLQTVFKPDHLPLRERLIEMIADPEKEWTNGWTRACVLQAVGKLGLTELAEVVEGALAIEEHPVRETAVWTLYTLAPHRLKRHQERLKQDSNPYVAKLAASLPL